MNSTIDPTAQQFLNSVNNIQSRLTTAERQISSGVKVTQPSDAPDQVSGILQLHADIQRNQDIQDSLGQVQTEVNTGEQVLSNSVDLLQQASVVATEATSTGQTADTRAQLAQSVQGIMEQMVSNSQTSVGGRYIFSGDLDQTPLYQLDLTQPNGVDQLQPVTAATRQAQAPNGVAFPFALSANDIFDHSDPVTGNPLPDNVFAALNGLRTALLANDDTGIRTSIANLQSASTYMNNELAFYGQTQIRVSSGLTQAQNLDVQLRSELSGKQDADLTQAILELNQGQVQLQATLQARAQMPRQTLFNMLTSA